MDLSVIVPVYNGEKTLPELYQRIRNALDRKYVYEILFIYDFGKDNSWMVIQELIYSDPSIVRSFHLKRNYGQHNAILYGMTRAHGNLIVTLDEDLQHDPEYIKDLISEQKEGDFDVVYGKFEKLQHQGMRVRTSEMLRLILKVFVPGLYPYYSPYRLIKKEVAGKISGLKNSYTFVDGYIGWTTNKISNVPVKHFKRADGESSYSYFKLLKHAIFIIVSYSKVKTWLLFTSLVLNLAAIGFYKFNQEGNSTFIGKTTVVLFSAGITLLFLALIAEILHHSSLCRNTKPVELK
jgi:undecaprenyl-phosphate 4-deoxy-4-formamido-L-arabinose transferase